VQYNSTGRPLGNALVAFAPSTTRFFLAGFLPVVSDGKVKWHPAAMPAAVCMQQNAQSVNGCADSCFQSNNGCSGLMAMGRLKG
jgi:hypothetical protein